MKLIGKYRNGNYNVSIFDDGTKIRETEEDEFIPDFSENCDVKLTDKCSMGCPWCYEGCTSNGLHSNIDLESPFFKSLHPYTELAINGNDMDHPQLVDFLKALAEKKVIANITLNQKQFEKNFAFVKQLQESGLVHGIGVSLVSATDSLIKMMKSIDNCVLHTICGVLSKEDIEILKDKGIKILILGYKNLKRGKDYMDGHMHDIALNRMYLYTVLPLMTGWFDVVSFDNLAIKQLAVKRLLDEKEWDEFYMGDDGQYTFYVDLVKNEYAMNSLAEERFPMGDKTIDEMFNHVRNLSKQRRVVRHSLFETNSSSIHSIVFPAGKCEQKLKPDNHGVIRFPCGDFSDTGIVYGLHDKLSYLCSYIALNYYDRYETEEQVGQTLSAQQCWELENILEAIQKEYPDVLELKAIFCENAVFDHQTHPSCRECIVDLYDIDQIHDFLFNDDIKIKMDRD